EKEPARRYQSAAEFAEDLRRYLSGEAVMAVPPSLAYRTSKFVRRNKTVVAAAALIGLSLIAGIVAFAWQARIARAQAMIAQHQEQVAQARAKDLQQVADFEASLLGQTDPARAGAQLSADVRAKYAAGLASAGVNGDAQAARLAAFDREWQHVNATDAARDLIDAIILKPAVAAIEKRFNDQPLVAATLRQTLSARYYDMGMYDAALPLQRSALDIRRRLLGEDDRHTIVSTLSMCALLVQMGRPTDAAAMARELLARTQRLYGADDPITMNTEGLLGLIVYDEGHFEEAERYYKQTLQAQRRVFGENSDITQTQIHNIGLLLMYRHRYAEAAPYLREAAQRLPQLLGPEQPNSLMASANLGYLLEKQGHYEQALATLDDTYARARMALGDTHQVTLVLATLSAMTLEALGRHADAEQRLAASEAAARSAFTGSNDFLRGTFLWQLGLARTGTKEFAAAEDNLLEAHAIFLTTHNITHADDLRGSTQALVDLYTAWEKSDPGKGHAAKATGWQAKLAALEPSTASDVSPR
ncbi:MAG: tetratricopeptide repeat-containing protein, partial [Proteobacteria bacterium]|nr:tetratricopeptide repeat-containing protein [Pseudomonadota bacterium]